MKNTAQLLGLFFVAASLCSSGCAPKWYIVNNSRTERFRGYRLKPPRKWMKLEDKDTLHMSRHDPALESITVFRKRPRKPFEKSNLTIGNDVLPFELAEMVIGDIAVRDHVSRIRVHEVLPLTVDGVDAVSAELSFATPAGLRRRMLICMVPCGKWYYEIRFSAVQRHYYGEYVDDMKAVVESMRLPRRVKRRAPQPPSPGRHRAGAGCEVALPSSTSATPSPEKRPTISVSLDAICFDGSFLGTVDELRRVIQSDTDPIIPILKHKLDSRRKAAKRSKENGINIEYHKYSDYSLLFAVFNTAAASGYDTIGLVVSEPK